MSQKLIREKDVYKILRKFVIDEVHGADFCQGQDQKHTLTVLHKWWLKHRNQFEAKHESIKSKQNEHIKKT